MSYCNIGLIAYSVNGQDRLVFEQIAHDAVVGIACLALLLMVWKFAQNQLDRLISVGLILALGAFIALCGLDHLLERPDFDVPRNRTLGEVMLGTGLVIVSICWSFFLARALCRTLKGPDEVELLVALRTKELHETIERLTRTEAERDYLSTLFESTEDAIILKDLKGIVTAWNSGAERLYGYHRDEMIGQPLTVLFPEECLIEESNILSKVPAGDRLHHFESVRLHKSGRVIHVSLSISAIRNGSGEILGISNIARDVTARKRVEENLRVSEERFSKFMKHFPGHAWIKDSNGRHLFVNDAILHSTSKVPDEILGKTVDEVFSVANAYVFRDSDRQVLQRGEAIQTVVSDNHNDGLFRHAIISEFLIPGCPGEPPMIGGMAIDITERIRAEQELRESENRFRLLADAMPQIVWTAGSDGVADYHNQRWFDYTGFSKEPLGADYLNRLVHPDDLPKYLESWKSSVEAGEPYQNEFRLKNHQTGEYRWHLGRVSPVKDESGQVVRWFGTATDIDGHKRAEASLRVSDQILRAIGDSIPFGIWTCDPMGRNTYISQSFLHLVGMTQDECFEYGWGDALDPKEREQTIEAWKACVRDEGIWDVERQFLGTDGQHHPILVRGIPVRDEDGRLVCWAGIHLDTSRLRITETALRETQERQRRALSTAKVGHWEWNATSNQFSYLDSLSLLYGRPDDQPFTTFEDYLDVVHPQDQNLVRVSTRSALARGDSYAIEYRVIWPDGSIHWLASRGTADFDPEGKSVRLVGVNLEISERKADEAQILLLNQELEQRVRQRTAELDKAIEALRESERRFRAIFNSTFQSIGLLTPDGNLIEVNTTALNFAGVKRDDVVGKLIWETRGWAPTEDARDRLKRAVADAAAGKFVRYEEKHPRADGLLVPVDFSINPVTNESGVVTLLIPEGREISAIRKAMEDLEQSEERFRGAFDASAIGMALVSPDGCWLRANRAILDILGYSEAELLGMTLQEITHPDDLTTDLDLVEQVLDGKTAFYQSEKRYIHKDQHVVWIVLTATLVRDASGQPLHFVAQIEDITARTQAAEDLRRARDEAMKATRAKGNFLANMSHEIRTPMNGVIGMTNLLLDTSLNSLQRNYAETIRGSSEALLTVINDILDFSKIEAGKLTLESTPFVLQHLIEEVSDLLAPRVYQKGLEINSRVDPKIPGQLSGDPIRIRQILTNLAGNAVKFTDHGEVTIAAILVSRNEKSATIRISVHDTGIGVAEERQTEIFESFTQIEEGKSRSHGGTGLGLAICRDLIELMRGQLGINSMLNQGSTFWFEVAFEIVAEQTQGPVVDFDGLRVLVVDDHQTNREIIKEVLLSWRCRPEVASSGTEAFSILQSSGHDDPFRVVVLDHQMPSLDGLQTARLIRKVPRFADLAILLCTTLGESVEEGDTEDSLFQAKLMKPMRRSQLYNAICRLACSLQHSIALPAAASPPIEPPVRLGLRILLAEDNVVNRRVAIGMVERLGCEIVAVENGRQALEALERDHFDLILMDVQMPVMDGHTATHAIRENEASTHLHVPIIAMTAHAMQGDRERCLQAGMDDYLSKPLRPAKLRDVLIHWNEQRKQNRIEIPSTTTAHDQKRQLADTLTEICGDDPDFAKEIVTLMLNATPSHLERLNDAIRDKDAQRIAWEAHSLKGVFLSVGADSLGSCSQEIITSAKREDLERVESLRDSLQELWNQLHIEARNFLLQLQV